MSQLSKVTIEVLHVSVAVKWARMQRSWRAYIASLDRRLEILEGAREEDGRW